MTGPTISSSRFSIRAHPHLYEINTLVWLEEISARLGRRVTLADVPDAEWAAIKRNGFDIVWLMGVWKRSPKSREIALAKPANFPEFDRALPGWKPEDVVGSPYAIVGYAPDPLIGSWEALDRARAKLHERGMALYLDFVGNHTALDHPWTREHPEFYVRGTLQDFEKNPSAFFRAETQKGPRYIARASDPYFSPWDDVAQLNHFQPALRAAHLADLRNIAQHCDGVRCDMAMLQLNDIFAKGWGHLLEDPAPPAEEFWSLAHAAVPDLTLLAEAYWGTEPRLVGLGFSFAYDKGLYDALRDTKIYEMRGRLTESAETQSHYARFLENHDEARYRAVFGDERLGAVGTSAATLPGMRFYHQGELEGRMVHLPIELRRQAPEAADPASSNFFQRILALTDQEVYHTGAWGLLEVTPEGDATSENLIAYEWRSAEAWKVIVVNLSGGASQGRVQLGDRASRALQYVFDDELNVVSYQRDGAEINSLGLFVRREGFQAHVFDVTPA